jgi:glucose-1-phosphate adenylyltransferase
MDRLRQPLARDAMAYVLAGGRGSRLHEMTDTRAKPAVYFGGKSRIIDFALSNAVNSGIRRIGVATQYKAHSLIRHLQRGWNFLRPERNESFDILPASQRVSEFQWYEGTADAVYQNIDIIEAYGVEYMVILAGDHIYKMDYELLLQQHCDSGADVTVACLEVPRMDAVAFGVMHVDEQDRIIDFVEKPADPPAMPGKPDVALASMGIYVFNTRFLIEELRRDAATEGSARDFGKDIIPHIVKHGKAVAHLFSRSCVRSTHEAGSYWRDVGTVDAYWAANIDLTDVLPELDLYDRHWPISTYSELTPPAKFVHDIDGRRGSAVASLVSGDCIVSGASVHRSLLFTGVRAHSFAMLDEAVVLPYVHVGRGARLRKVVIDRGVVIPDGLVVGDDPELDAQRFRRTDNGVVLITQPMIDRL